MKGYGTPGEAGSRASLEVDVLYLDSLLLA
jgi:hypothetical protein